MIHANLRLRAAVRLAGLRPLVPTRPSGPGDHTKAPGGSRGGWFTRTCGFVPQFAWRASARWSQRGPPGLVITQKAPGGSRGTPGHAPVRLPCDAGSSRGSACRRAAWMAGWFSGPESPGFHPGLLGAETGGATQPSRSATTPGQACTGHGWPCRREGKPAPRLRPRRAKPAGGCVSRRRIPSGLLRLTARLAWRASHRPAGRTLAATTPGQACRGHGWPGRREIQSPRSSRKFSRSATRLE